MQLPQAYRSLPRPSSPLDAKASTVRLIAFDLDCVSSVDVIPQHCDTAHLERHRPHLDLRLSKSETRRGGINPAPTGRGNGVGVVCGRHRRTFDAGRGRPYSSLQKGGDPAAGSPTATLLRLRPSHWIDPRRLPPCGWRTDFRSPQLPWRDGRCVQGPGTYSPWRG